MINWILMGGGGFVGALGRYGLISLLRLLGIGGILPLLLVNGLGCFAAGALAGLHLLSSRWQIFLMAGSLGAFTTFSAYAVQLLQALLAGRFSLVLLIMLGQNLLSLLLVFVGYKLMQFLL